MYSALADLHPPPGGWTTDDLDRLPEDGHRYELLDGLLIIHPSRTSTHQNLVSKLARALEPAAPWDWDITHGVEIRVHRQQTLVPDVLAVDSATAAQDPAFFQPHEVALAIEVVSPNSVTLDRITKPALYAQAGIPFYWRVETEGGIVVHTHRLAPEGDVYGPTGQFRDTIKIDEPWELEIPIAEITPPYYRPQAKD